MDSGLSISDICADTDPDTILRYIRGLNSISRHASMQAVRERVLPPTLPSAPRETSSEPFRSIATTNELTHSKTTGEQTSAVRGIPVAVPSTLSATTATQTLLFPNHPLTLPANIGLLTTQLLYTPPSCSPTLEASPSLCPP